ncbi:MAG: STAS domain-containing protein [Calditrichaeota bacterium]|nr:STAS domain-containing protein [Calditrichota bacterium]
MSTRILESNGIATIQLSGNLSAKVVQEIENLFSCLGERGTSRILLDLAEVQTVEAAAVPILVRTVVTLRTRGGELRIVNAREQTHDVLGHRRLRRFFGISPTVEKALETLARHDPCRQHRLHQRALAAGLA